MTYYQQTWTINQDGSIQSTVYSVTETEMTNAERLKKNIDERLEKQEERKEVKEKAEEREEQDSKLHGEPQRLPVIEGAEQKAMVGHMQEESELAARERMQKEKMGGIYHSKIDINI